MNAGRRPKIFLSSEYSVGLAFRDARASSMNWFHSSVFGLKPKHFANFDNAASSLGA